ncbi:excalibur calcium-binding domain-containing protein [Modestobacter italicus]|uniref:excalibur calcium-binding domain-containing protein n=1 Tax=Modestobacter italicus (strain DSM 44449 / CECT 9708 / BC 501) TaxID=2732864 RepID=UPI0027DF9939|nr:excalibur calcium-binding domain-containing protein [Modestobacter italicus]
MPDTTAMPSYGAQPPAAQEKQPKKWLRWGVPVLAFLIGAGVGTAGAEPDVEVSPAYLSLQSELTDSQQEAEQLADEVADAEARIRQATADGEARLAAQATELEQRTVALDQRETELAGRESALRVSAQSGAVLQPAPAPKAAPSAAPAPQAPASTYFKNCDAARAAGAAPVRVGDPGYAGHLDRDGDGVGCE